MDGMNEEVDPAGQTTCRHCGRGIIQTEGVWVDPEATGDDSVWRETCDEHDTFVADHEPDPADVPDHTIGDYTIAYTCPVYVEIQDGKVVKVVVEDDNLSDPDLSKVTDADREGVLKLLDDSEWPGWTFGW